MFDGLYAKAAAPGASGLGVAERRDRYRRTPARRPRVLLVQDDPVARGALARELSADFRVTAVGSAAEALALFRAGRFAVALAVHRMPDMTGLELLEQLRTREPDLCRVLISDRELPGLDGYLASGLIDACEAAPPSSARLHALLARRREA